MSLRACQIILVWAWSLLLAVIAWNNVVDYGSNLEFVRHVLSMDTVFEGSQLRGRAITSGVVHHAAYWLIIATEIAIASLAAWGGWRLFRGRKLDLASYVEAKRTAIAALLLGILLWLVGFLTIGGEWFAMWQSTTWNGQQSAFRMFALNGILLMVVLQTGGEAAASPAAGGDQKTP